MERIICGLFVLTGIIHLLPVSGLLGAERLTALYGVSLEDNNLSLLMQHRAVLFGLLGGLLIGAAFKPIWRGLALTAGFVSVVSFLILALISDGYNDAIQSVVNADLIAAVALALIVVLMKMKGTGRSGEKS